jgi:tetratricopeptide (TPR) repeat protein
VIARNDRPRRVIPRWRSPWTGPERAETQVIGAPATATHASSAAAEIEAATHAWHDLKNERTAGELLAAASLTGEARPEARTAAEFLMHTPSASRASRRVSQRFLDGAPTSPEQLMEQKFEDRIAELKAAVIRNPRNALAWTERSRQYTLQGQLEPAKQSMRCAVAVAPDHRLVLRSAARLFIHRKETDEAQRLLSSSSRTVNDPWLLASEIAAATYGGRSSRLIATGRRMLESGRFPAEHLTELASAVATVDLEAGADRRARRLFESSITAPNDNSLAQAEWAAARLNVRGIDEKLRTTPESYEALALAASSRGRVDDALEHGWAWLMDQPFSPAPAFFGSHVAARAMLYARGAQFAEQGLIANPGAPMLVNNLAFCLARLNRPLAAHQAIARLDRSKLSDYEVPVITATQGLIAFRSGNPDEGRRLYLDAISALANNRANRAIARLMLAVEEIRVAAPEWMRSSAVARSDAKAHLAGDSGEWLRHLDDAQSGREGNQPDQASKSA